MKYLQSAYRYLLVEPFLLLFRAIFEPGRFRREYEISGWRFWKRIVPMLRLFLPMFVFCYPIALIADPLLVLLRLASYHDLANFFVVTSIYIAVGVAGGVVFGIAGGIVLGIVSGMFLGIGGGVGGGIPDGINNRLDGRIAGGIAFIVMCVIMYVIILYRSQGHRRVQHRRKHRGRRYKKSH